MKLLSLLLLLLVSPGVSAAPPPDIFAPPVVPTLSLPPVLFLRLPPPHQSGDLARDRLGEMAFVLLSASKVSLADPGQPQSVLLPSRAKSVLAALSNLVLNDALYVSDADYQMQDKSSRVTLMVGDFGKEITVSFWRNKPLMTINSENAHRWITANYLPVLPKVISLFQAIDPNDPGLNTTLAIAPPPNTKDIPAFVLTRIATLKPGMTRTDVLRMFTTEGGVSTTYWNHYVYRSDILLKSGQFKSGQYHDMMQVPGGLVKVNVDFAPPDADIIWLSGRGFWLGQNQYLDAHNRLSLPERPDDVVLNVSAPYIQYMIAD